MVYSWSHALLSPGENHGTSPSIGETSKPEKPACSYFYKNEFKESIVLKFTHIFTKKSLAAPNGNQIKNQFAPRCAYHLQTNTLRTKPCSCPKQAPGPSGDLQIIFYSRAPSRGSWPSHSLRKMPFPKRKTTYIVAGRVAQRPGRVPGVSQSVHRYVQTSAHESRCAGALERLRDRGPAETERENRGMAAEIKQKKQVSKHTTKKSFKRTKVCYAAGCW